jgi:chitinase
MRKVFLTKLSIVAVLVLAVTFLPKSPSFLFSGASHNQSSEQELNNGKYLPKSENLTSKTDSSQSPANKSEAPQTKAHQPTVVKTTFSKTSTSASSLPFIHPSKIILAYYSDWSTYEGYTPDKINASNINILDYAFATVGSDLKITASDSSIDYSNFSKLKILKSKYPALKIVISVGGWDDSGMFSDAALTESSRDTFADSVVSFIKAYGFDGVDIDWEYPIGGGLSSNVSRPADKTNFGLLLKTLRSKLNAQGILDNKHYILSFTGEADSTFASSVDLADIANSVDYGFIMAYDLNGGWDSYTDFDAPLYIPAGQSPNYTTSVDAVVRSWLNNGFPAQKIILGVPFYGYAYTGVTNSNDGLLQRFSSATTVGFNTIMSNYLSNPSYVKYSESTAQVPWLFNGKTFISYDNVNSISAKAQYAVSKNLLGVGAWNISYDPNCILINAIKNIIG